MGVQPNPKTTNALASSIKFQGPDFGSSPVVCSAEHLSVKLSDTPRVLGGFRV